MGKTAVFYVIFLIGLWYIALGGNNDMALPQIPKSATTKGSNAFYTDYWRKGATDYYYHAFQQLHCRQFKIINPFCYIKPFKLNHSTNLASSYFAPKQKSSYLEEYYYPLTDSVIINGWEPYDSTGKRFNKTSQVLIKNNKRYNSEITIKLNQTTVINRMMIYILIWVCLILEVKMFNKIKK